MILHILRVPLFPCWHLNKFLKCMPHIWRQYKWVAEKRKVWLAEITQKNTNYICAILKKDSSIHLSLFRNAQMICIFLHDFDYVCIYSQLLNSSCHVKKKFANERLWFQNVIFQSLVSIFKAAFILKVNRALYIDGECLLSKKSFSNKIKENLLIHPVFALCL